MTNIHKHMVAVLAISAIELVGVLAAHSADLALDVDPRTWSHIPRVLPPAGRSVPSQFPASERAPSDRPSKNGTVSKVAEPPAAPPDPPKDKKPAQAPVQKGSDADASGYLIPLALAVLATIGLLSIIGSVPRLVRAIDRLFQPTVTDQQADDDPFEPAGTHPDKSVEEYRLEVKAMRAMKEELVAQAEAARAALREQRAQAQDQQENAA